MSTILPTRSHTIAILSQKGGTGKTTLVRTLTDVLRRVGMEVLPIDLDPQGNLSDYFDVDPDAAPTIGEVLSGRAHIGDSIHRGLVPANLGLAEAELILAGKIGREMTLKRALREARREYDFIIIDCPPALGLLTVNALVAASHALISSETEYFSLQGVQQALQLMDLARENLNENLDWLGVVFNIADLRTVHARDAFSSLQGTYPDKVFNSVIRKSVRYPESAERGVSILDYRPELGVDYVGLADELLSRLGDDETRERVGALRAELAGAGSPDASLREVAPAPSHEAA